MPSSAALRSARVCWIDMRLPTPYGPPVNPVFINQTQVPFLAMFCPSSLLYTVGCSGMKGAPKQVENVA